MQNMRCMQIEHLLLISLKMAHKQIYGATNNSASLHQKLTEQSSCLIYFDIPGEEPWPYGQRRQRARSVPSASSSICQLWKKFRLITLNYQPQQTARIISDINTIQHFQSEAKASDRSLKTKWPDSKDFPCKPI